MIFDALKLALSSIWQYKARAALTILGIVIGISSVVMFMALGEGLRVAVNSEISSLGANLLAILPGQFDPSQGGGFSTNLISGDILKLDDVTDLQALSGVQDAAPMTIVGGVLRRNTTVAPQTMLLGSTPEFVSILTALTIDQGRMFTAAENTARDRVIVLGSGVATALFGDDTAVGQTVLIGKDSFTVVGVTKASNSTSVFGGSDYASMTFIPILTAGDITGGVKVMRILVTLEDGVDTERSVKTVKQTLLVRHTPEDFTVLTQDDLLGTVNKILNLLTSAVAAIASISLVVAGVGIMNIMLVSVTERTKEIGLRKAVGATTAAILWQFLIESIVLSVLGALIAVGLAWGAAQAAARLSPLTPVITSEAIALAVGVGVVVGLVFGIAPAYRAAKLDPIVALRHD
ncbi:ABC transporter permease [Candidatus Berkelbacteria bacterium]|nr:ABC transporter permease [Candidatus Berkelbacteria bacterium]